MEVSDAQFAFPQLGGRAGAGGCTLTGDATAGIFKDRPRGVSGFLLPTISGRYSGGGARGTITIDQDLPPGQVGEKLAQAGLRSVDHQQARTRTSLPAVRLGFPGPTGFSRDGFRPTLLPFEMPSGFRRNAQIATVSNYVDP